MTGLPILLVPGSFSSLGSGSQMALALQSLNHPFYGFVNTCPLLLSAFQHSFLIVFFSFFWLHLKLLRKTCCVYVVVQCEVSTIQNFPACPAAPAFTWLWQIRPLCHTWAPHTSPRDPCRYCCLYVDSQRAAVIFSCLWAFIENRAYHYPSLTYYYYNPSFLLLSLLCIFFSWLHFGPSLHAGP